MQIILLPGLDGTGIFYDNLRKQLEPQHSLQIIRYPTDKFLDYAELENLIRSQLPNNEDFVILAESFSGPLGISISANAPKNLKGLILCVTFAKNPAPLFLSFEFLAGLFPIKIIPKWIINFFFFGQWKESSIESQLHKVLAEIPTRILKQRVRCALKVDRLNLLPAIKIPTLYLQARQDRIIRKKSARLIAQELKSMDIIKIDGPHFLLQVRARESAEAIKQFIEKTFL